MAAGSSRRFFIMPVRLSSRLAALAALVPEHTPVIDVGTDHAMLPVWLVQTGRSPWAIGTDIRPGPLRTAAALVEETCLSGRVRLVLTDGLTGLEPVPDAAVTVAGMGGETIVSILSAAPWIREGPTLILSPQSKRAELRRWLISSGYEITSERLVKDAGRIYPILTARGGAAPPYTEAELHLGRLDQIGSDPLFREYLSLMRARAAKAAPYDGAAARLLEEYRNIQGGMTNDVRSEDT